MMEKHRCRLCFKDFINGKALGGHMRSHVMKAKKDEKTKPLPQSLYSNSSSESTYYYSEEEEEDEVKQSTFLMDRESETESKKKNPICRRSKRVRKTKSSDFYRFEINGFLELKKSNISEDSSMAEVEPLSSVSDITPEENVAHCLIMLSKDSWKRDEEENDYYYQSEEDDSDVGKVIFSSSKVKGKYKCETCKKLFKSYQALGGHRASHKKIKVSTTTPPPLKTVEAEEKIHECPVCKRVFSSGQALGGHKRSHFVNGASRITSTIIESSRTGGEGLDIDLNLPAPIDEEDGDDEISQTTFSAVSDAEFVYSFKESS